MKLLLGAAAALLLAHPTAARAQDFPARPITMIVVFAPKGTPRPVVEKLSGALSAALEDPAVRRRIEELGSVPPRPDQAGPDALRDLVRSEVERWSAVVRAAGIGEP
jgi:tripartite-type tricarboxylate transporter receptor subunit TctC